jgi:hypothetical protein
VGAKGPVVLRLVFGEEGGVRELSEARRSTFGLFWLAFSSAFFLNRSLVIKSTPPPATGDSCPFLRDVNFSPSLSLHPLLYILIKVNQHTQRRHPLKQALGSYNQGVSANPQHGDIQSANVLMGDTSMLIGVNDSYS